MAPVRIHEPRFDPCRFTPAHRLRHHPFEGTSMLSTEIINWMAIHRLPVTGYHNCQEMMVTESALDELPTPGTESVR